MAYEITSPRPWFAAKLRHALQGLAAFEGFTVSETYDDAELQDVVDALAALSAALKEE